MQLQNKRFNQFSFKGEKKKNTVRATTRRPSNHPIRDVTRPLLNRSKWHISGLICFPRSSTREDQVIGFAPQWLYKNKCALWRHYPRTKEFWLIWSKTSPAQFVLMLRTIQSGAIAAGVSPSPAPSLGKWSRGFAKACGSICCDFFLHFTHLERKISTLYHLRFCAAAFEMLRTLLCLEWQLNVIVSHSCAHAGEFNTPQKMFCYLSDGTNWITLRENEEKGLGTKKPLPKWQWPSSVRGKQN